MEPNSILGNTINGTLLCMTNNVHKIWIFVKEAAINKKSNWYRANIQKTCTNITILQKHCHKPSNTQGLGNQEGSGYSATLFSNTTHTGNSWSSVNLWAIHCKGIKVALTELNTEVLGKIGTDVLYCNMPQYTYLSQHPYL